MAESKHKIEKKILLENLGVPLPHALDPSLEVNEVIQEGEPTTTGFTPLTYAINSHNSKLTFALIGTSDKKNGCNLNLRNERFLKTPLETLYSLTYHDTNEDILRSRIARLLILKGASLTTKIPSSPEIVTILDATLAKKTQLERLLNGTNPINSIPSRVSHLEMVVFEAVYLQCEPLVSDTLQVNTCTDVMKLLDTLPGTRLLPAVVNDLISQYFNLPEDIHFYSFKNRSAQFWTNTLKLGQLCFEYRLSESKNTSEMKASNEPISSSVQHPISNLGVSSLGNNGSANLSLQSMQQIISEQANRIKTLEDQVAILNLQMRKMMELMGDNPKPLHFSFGVTQELSLNDPRTPNPARINSVSPNTSCKTQ